MNPRSVIEEIQNFDIQSIKDKLEFQRRYSGKDGLLTRMQEYFKSLAAEEKRQLGSSMNLIKRVVEEKLKNADLRFFSSKMGDEKDLSRPVGLFFSSDRHILNCVMDEVCDIFSRIGFDIFEGPEIETEFFNFSALNFPDDHPARDMQDTFFIDGVASHLLRTHTSPVQVRVMSTQSPPLRFLAPGKVFRCDHDATHSPVFHQVEGLFVDKEVSFSDLKSVLVFFARSFFGDDVQVRFRPSFFPFTEPSAEMDILWKSKGNTWLEILGCGMVHPQVLINAGIDPDIFSGYAFGVGVERLAMLKYGIGDIRLFYENDIRFLSPQMNQ